jgi:hypothetical protein
MKKLVFLLLFVSLSAYPASLKDRRFMKYQNRKLQEYVVDEGFYKCKNKKTDKIQFKTKIDWKSFKIAMEGDYRDNIASSCNIAEGIRRICKDDVGREAARKLKKLVCKFNKFSDVEDRRKRHKMTIKGDTLFYETSLTGANKADFVQNYLNEHLE